MAHRKLSQAERAEIQKRVDSKFNLYKRTTSAETNNAPVAQENNIMDWSIVKSRTGLKKGDRLDDGRIVRYVDPQGRVYVDKSEAVKFTLASMADCRNLAQKIAKGEVNTSSMKVFDENGDLLDNDSVTRLLMEMAGDGTRMVPTPGNNGARFPDSASIVDRPANSAAPSPMKPYEYADEDGGFQPWKKVGPNFVAGTADPGIAPASPARFPDVAAKPQVDAGQPFDDVRAGDPVSTVFVSKAARKVAKGTFANLIGDPFRANDGTGA
jgi:hypothetical protein